MNTLGGDLTSTIQSTYHGYREEVRTSVRDVTTYEDEFLVSFRVLDRISHVEDGFHNGTALFHVIFDLSQVDEYIEILSVVSKVKIIYS